MRDGVVGQHVGVGTDGVGASDLPGVQVDGEQRGVGVAGDKRQPFDRVEGEPVVCWQLGNTTWRTMVSVARSTTARLLRDWTSASIVRLPES